MIKQFVELSIIVVIAALVGFLVVGATRVSRVPAKVVVAPVDSPHGAIVRLVANSHTFCTGTVVAPNLIITAAHCVLEPTPFGYMMHQGPIEIRPEGNQSIGTTAMVNYASPQMDQAILIGDFSAYPTMKYISAPEKLGTYRLKHTVFTSCGYPLGGDLFCNQTVFDKPADFFWDVDGVLMPGMSGGPTFLPDGTMVGVNVAVHDDKSVISPIYNINKNVRGN
jgi:hypothetical protein